MTDSALQSDYEFAASPSEAYVDEEGYLHLHEEGQSLCAETVVVTCSAEGTR